jgi:release factor glutamine methyltransferase
VTAREALAEAEQRLAAAGVETPRVDAEWLVAHLLGATRSGLASRLDDEVDGLEPLLVRREAREPLAYVLGEWGFRRLTLKTDARALVPRPETETLVERALALAAGIERPRILDVGVGSGAIALALKDERPDAEVTGVDVSHEALALARENGERLGLDVELRRGDGFEVAAEGWDLVVANPPYVESLTGLQPELHWEPEIALLGSGDYDRLARAANAQFLVVEVAGGWAQSVASTFTFLGWRDVRATADLTGIERVVEGADRNETVAALHGGKPVILPTDTVYGLCALPWSEDTLYKLKGRDRSKPVAWLFADVDELLAHLPGVDRRVLERYLPGPYTLVVRDADQRTVGVRVPNLPPAAAEAVRAVGFVLSTSANLSGGPDPPRVEDIPEEIRAHCGAIVDVGELPGVPSTVVDLTGPEPRVIRRGAGPLPE